MKRRRGRPSLYPGHKMTTLAMTVQVEERDAFFARVPKSDRPAWLRDAFARKLNDKEIITREWLDRVGIASDGNYRDDYTIEDCILVRFCTNDPYANQYGFSVWLTDCGEMVRVGKITTVSQLCAFCQLVTGKTIEEVVRQNDGEKKCHSG